MTEHARIGFPILRSLEDGHQTIGPMVGDEAGVRAYLAFMRGQKRPVWRVEGIVWVKEKPIPEGWAIHAEIIEADPRPSGPSFILLGGRR